MSLCKESCKKCWLPPDKASEFCRNCKGPSPLSEIARIRFKKHTKEDCVFFKEKLLDTKFTGNCFAEDCLQCSYYIVKGAGVNEIHKRAFHFLYSIHSCDILIERIRGFLKKNHDLTLDFITELLYASHEDDTTSKKILTALVAASGKRKWILQELILRPVNLGFLLANPMIIPGPFSENLWGYMETFEDWWSFWEETRVAAKRKVKFRTLLWKEELMIMTWHPDHFVKWCLDIEEYAELISDWS